MELPYPQRSPEWVKAHHGRITSSTAAAVLGECPYKSPLQAYNRIMGLTVDKVNHHMQRGIDLEPHSLGMYEIETGRLTFPTGLWVHDRYDWLGASPDAMVGDDGMVETKRPVVLPDAIPRWHYIQMAVQLVVTGRSWCDYYVWAEGKSYLQRMMIDGDYAYCLVLYLQAWYEMHIKTSTPPKKSRRARGRQSRNL